MSNFLQWAHLILVQKVIIKYFANFSFVIGFIVLVILVLPLAIVDNL